MRRLKNNKGQMRVIEVILASFIIVSALAFVRVFAVNPTSPGYEMTDLEETGYSALHDLDQQGLLVPLVYEERWNDLRVILKMTMPNDVYFNMTIYTLDKYNQPIVINDFDSPILYGDSNTFTSAKNIASLTYCISGRAQIDSSTGRPINGASYELRVLVLQLTRG